MTTSSHSLTKKLFLFTLLATTGTSFTQLSNEAISDVYENELQGAAKYLEFFFIFQPNNKIQTASMDFTVTLTAAAAALLLSAKTFCFKNTASTPANVPSKDTISPIDITTVITSGMLIAAGGYAYHCKLERAIKRTTLLNFLSNWEHHRTHLPAEFTAAFDELAAYIQAKGNLTDAQISEIFELVQHYIEHCFEKRYPKEKKSPDVLGSLKTITEIGKNLTPAAK